MEKTRELLSSMAKAINDLLNNGQHPPPVGFVLLVFPFDGPEGARTNYVSNADRKTMLAGLKEIVARFEGQYHEGEADKVN
jgi:hypothetical protein